MTVRCPRCLGSNPVSKDVFRQGYRCVRCGTEVVASALYSRVLSVLSMLVGAGFLLAVHVRVLYFFIWIIPVWLLVLSGMVRVVPYFVPPRLELRDSGTVTILGISDEKHPE